MPTQVVNVNIGWHGKLACSHASGAIQYGQKEMELLST